MGTLSKISTATGILVMLIPAAVHIIWPPSAVCIEVCGLALVCLESWRGCWRNPRAAARPLEEAEPMPRAKRPLPDVTCCHCGGVIHEDDRSDALFSRCKTRPAKEVWIHKTCWKKELQAWKH